MRVFNGGLRAGLNAARAALLLACVLLLGVQHAAVAQCPPVFADGEPGQGIRGTTTCAINFDPDGAGPSPSLFIVGGTSLELPGLRKCKLLAFDGVRWSTLDIAPTINAGQGTINAMTIFNGELIVAGHFTSIAGVPATNIAAWNGTQWRALGAGLPGTCSALGVFQGALYAGLSFVSPQALLRWNGTAWSSPTVASFSGVTGISINALETVGTSLYVGGLFDGAGGMKINNLARFDGSNYFAFGNPDGEVLSLAQYTGNTVATQRLFVGGAFANIGGLAAPRVASFAPSTAAWSAIVPAVSATWRNCKGIFVRSGRNSYDLSVVAGTGSSIFPTTTGMQLVSGAWTSQGIEELAAWSLFAGRYVALGRMVGSRVQWLDAGVWRAFGDGLYGPVNDVLPVDDTLIAISALRPDALEIQGLGTSPWRIVSRPLSGGSWATFGEFNRRANTIERAANGDLLVGGSFSHVDGVLTRLIARWNGSTWSEVGVLVPGSVTDLLAEPSGDIIAGGSFTLSGIVEPVTVARWNGVSWSRIGSAFNGPVYRLERMPNGDLIAAGEFTIAGGVPARNIARWDGAQWSAMGPGFNGAVYALGVGYDGRLVAGGYFAMSGTLNVNGIARWSGATWEPLGSGVALGVECLAFRPTGELIVGGGIYSAGGIDVSAIAQWNGTEWSALGQGMDDFVVDLAVLPDGDVVACGTFYTADLKPSAYIARFSPGESGPTVSTQPVPQATCPAGSASFSVVADGTGPFTYQWRRGGVPINVVTMPSAATATLSLSNVAPVDVTSYDCVVTNSCGSTISSSAALTICAADFDCDGFITFEDFDSFVSAFEVGLASADFTGDGFLTFEDFDAFVAAFESGC